MQFYKFSDIIDRNDGKGKNVEMQSLYQKLLDYSDFGIYPFHMPGHKRRLMEFVNPYSIDITEIEGFDNLHHPKGILKEAMEDTAKLYGADQSYFLVNGSTAGILSSFCATTKRKGKILMARNCHKAAYHGVFLQELNPVYIYPQYLPKFHLQGGLCVEKMEKLLINNPDIQMVFITSPTYEGIVSDIEKIADCVHRYHIPLIVDEAHGAHFRYGKGFPVSALDLGADIVIQSLHKTLPSLTQTAILHVKSKYVDLSEMERYLSIYQSSSPSYLLLSSMIECIKFMEEKGSEYMQELDDNLRDLREKCSKLKYIKLMDSRFIGKYDIFAMDQSKLVFSVSETNKSGPEIYRILLNKYHLQMEMCGPSHVLAMAAIGDGKVGMQLLWDAVREIDSTLSRDFSNPSVDFCDRGILPGINLYDAVTGEKKRVALKDSEGEISGEFIYAYPPGIPILVPGEIINNEVLNSIFEYDKNGISLQGMEDDSLETINIIKKE